MSALFGFCDDLFVLFMRKSAAQMKENHASATNHLWSGCVCLSAFAASTCPIHFFLRHTNNATDASLTFGERNVKDTIFFRRKCTPRKLFGKWPTVEFVERMMKCKMIIKKRSLIPSLAHYNAKPCPSDAWLGILLRWMSVPRGDMPVQCLSRIFPVHIRFPSEAARRMVAFCSFSWN